MILNGKVVKHIAIMVPADSKAGEENMHTIMVWSIDREFIDDDTLYVECKGDANMVVKKIRSELVNREFFRNQMKV